MTWWHGLANSGETAEFSCSCVITGLRLYFALGPPTPSPWQDCSTLISARARFCRMVLHWAARAFRWAMLKTFTITLCHGAGGTTTDRARAGIASNFETSHSQSRLGVEGGPQVRPALWKSKPETAKAHCDTHLMMTLCHLGAFAYGSYVRALQMKRKVLLSLKWLQCSSWKPWNAKLVAVVKCLMRPSWIKEIKISSRQSSVKGISITRK